jgi:hypothetical protein
LFDFYDLDDLISCLNCDLFDFYDLDDFKAKLKFQKNVHFCYGTHI